jgi:hypothetical protein
VVINYVPGGEECAVLVEWMVLLIGSSHQNTERAISCEFKGISVANSVNSAYMVENMPYGIILYKEYPYCMMPYYGIKVWPSVPNNSILTNSNQFNSTQLNSIQFSAFLTQF